MQMKTMNDFELRSHAEYAKKFPEHEVSFFESMILPPWAPASLGATNHSNEDILNLILSYKNHHVLTEVLTHTHPIIRIFLYYRLLIFEKLLLSLDADKSEETIVNIRNILKALYTTEPYLYSEELLSEREIRELLIVLQATKKLDHFLADPFIRFTKIRKKLARFYRLIIKKVLGYHPNEITVLACYLNPYFQKPGGSNNKINKAAAEAFHYKKSALEWIRRYPRVALAAVYDLTTPGIIESDTKVALLKAATRFKDVAVALNKNEKIKSSFSDSQQKELAKALAHFEAQSNDAAKQPAMAKESKYYLTKSQRKEIKKQATQMFACLYKNSKKLLFHVALELQTNHLKDILTIILNNEKNILPIIATYWHKTFKKFKVHSYSSKFQKQSQEYVGIIINFFNDKDIGEEDDAKLKAFALEFIGICKHEKIHLKEKQTLSSRFEKVLDTFIELEA